MFKTLGRYALSAWLPFFLLSLTANSSYAKSSEAVIQTLESDIAEANGVNYELSFPNSGPSKIRYPFHASCEWLLGGLFSQFSVFSGFARTATDLRANMAEALQNEPTSTKNIQAARFNGNLIRAFETFVPISGREGARGRLEETGRTVYDLRGGRRISAQAQLISINQLVELGFWRDPDLTIRVLEKYLNRGFLKPSDYRTKIQFMRHREGTPTELGWLRPLLTTREKTRMAVYFALGKDTFGLIPTRDYPRFFKLVLNNLMESDLETFETFLKKRPSRYKNRVDAFNEEKFWQDLETYFQTNH